MTPAGINTSCCSRRGRRAFLADLGLGFTGMALGAMLADDKQLRASEVARTPMAPRAKSVIWVFLSGGYSHVETFDPKPALNDHAGKTFDKTPFENPVLSPLHKKRFRSVPAEEINVRDVYPTIYPMQIGWQKRGQAGIEVSDWWPYLSQYVDDLCFVRNMWTTDNDHAAENQMHTGRHRLDETQPSIGSWADYGLGTLNEDLPKFVVLGGPTDLTRDCRLIPTISDHSMLECLLHSIPKIHFLLVNESLVRVHKSSGTNSIWSDS
jgi:hypothetical protein